MNNKNDAVETISRFFEKAAGWCFDHRLIVLFSCLLILSACFWAASTVRFDNSFEAYFSRTDPTYNAFLEFREDFGSDEVSYILYEVPGKTHGPWDIDIMQKIDRLTQALEEDVPFVQRVISLTNVEFVEGSHDELIIHDLLLDFPESQEELLKIRENVLKKPIYWDILVSRDGKYAAIIVEMQKASTDPLDEIQIDPEKGTSLENCYPQATNTPIEKLLSNPEYSDIRFYHAGDVPLNAVYNTLIETESGSLGLITFLLIAILLLFFFRSINGVVGPLLVVFLSILITAAFVGVIGWSFDMMFTMLPTILIAVGVADAVHIISEFQTFDRLLDDRRAAICRSIYLVGLPCLFTSITTVAGFSSMSISPIKAVGNFAIYSAVGVFGAFLLSVTLLMVMLSFKRKPIFSKKRQRSKNPGVIKHVLKHTAGFDIKYRGRIILVFVVLFILSAAGIAKLKVDSNFLTQFSEDVEIRRVTEYVDDVMGGTASVSYVFDSGKPDGILDPKVLREIEALQAKANEFDLVMKTNSLVDILKDLNQSLHNEDPAYYVLPDTKQLAAQYMLLYESSGGDEIENYITPDYARANLEIRCKMVESSKHKELTEELDRYLKNRTGQNIAPDKTGMVPLWINLEDYITDSQIMGFALAYSVIAVMMCVLFGSVKVGMLSMIPNLSPVLLTLGIMGWAGVPLDYTKLLIGCVAIGIAVDDTIHLVTRYHLEFKRCGNYEEALKQSMNHVGRALLITTIVLVTGFLAFLFSIMDSLNHFGWLLASTIGFALGADFLLLPALILVLKPYGPEFEISMAQSSVEDSHAFQEAHI